MAQREQNAKRSKENEFPNMMEARTLPLEQNRGVQEGSFWRRIRQLILELLRQGVTPEKMALSLALGVALGVFPVLVPRPRFALWWLSSGG
jgi:uncharacterized protein (DUF2062 family)